MAPHRPILLAEDNENDVELTLAALRGLNLANEIVVVNDGAAVLDFLRCRNRYAGRRAIAPQVLFLDLKMPRVDGLETLRQIRADAEFYTLPVVILTSSAEETDLIRGYALGANGYVVKPVEFESFTRTVSEVGTFWASTNQPPPSVARTG